MSDKITIIDYEEIELYSLTNKKGRVITNSQRKNPSGKNTKHSLFCNYILEYNNTENAHDFLKRFKKV